jgi:hypothetical protein
VSDALDLLGGLVLEDGQRWAAAATKVQRDDAAAVLAEKTSTPYHWQTRSRGYSKTTDLGGVALTKLLKQAPPGSRSYAVAADQAQARLLLDAIEGFVRRSSELSRLLDVQSWKVTVRESGATLEALPADEAGAWGLRPFFAVCDELAMWGTTSGPRRIWDAITSAMPKTGGTLVIASTAGDPAHWSHKVREHALADSLWRVSETQGPPPWMPTRLIEEQRRRLPEFLFARLFENRWVSGEDRLVAVEDLRACVVLDGPLDPMPGHAYAIGLDVGLKRDSTVATICHLEGGVVTLDRIATWTGTRIRPVKLGEVEEWIAKAAKDYRAQVVVDPWQAAQLCERLRRRGVRVKEFTFSAQSVGRLASTLYLLLRERALRLPDDAELIDELANVRLRETSPGVMRMDHDAGRHDDRAIALALAAHRLVEKGEFRPATISVPRGRIDDVSRSTWRKGIPSGRIPTATDRRPNLDEVLAANGIPVAHDGLSETATYWRTERRALAGAPPVAHDTPEWNAALAQAELDDLLHRGGQ